MNFPFLKNLWRFTKVNSPVLERKEIIDTDLIYHFNNDTQIYIESLKEYDQIEFLKTVGYMDQTYWFYDELAGKHFGLGIRSRQGHNQLLLRFFTDHIEIKNGDMFSLFFKDNTGLSFLIENTPKRKDKYNISYYQCELNFNEMDLEKLSSHSVVGLCYYQPGMPLKKSPFELEDQSILQHIFQCFKECLDKSPF